jgi:hypothetical protein
MNYWLTQSLHYILIMVSKGVMPLSISITASLFCLCACSLCCERVSGRVLWWWFEFTSECCGQKPLSYSQPQLCHSRTHSLVQRHHYCFTVPSSVLTLLSCLNYRDLKYSRRPRSRSSPPLWLVVNPRRRCVTHH